MIGLLCLSLKILNDLKNCTKKQYMFSYFYINNYAIMIIDVGLSDMRALIYDMEHFFDFPAGEFPKSTTFCESERIAEFSNAEARSHANVLPKSRS